MVTILKQSHITIKMPHTTHWCSRDRNLQDRDS